MGWENRIIWGEGLFLQPQHLQQQERYFDRLVRSSTAPLRPFAWGLTQLELDKDLLTLGKFALRSRRRHPARRHALQHPRPGRPPAARSTCRRPRATASSTSCCPTRQPGAVEAAGPEHTGDRRPLRHRRARRRRQQRRLPISATLPIGKLRLRYRASRARRGPGSRRSGLARVIEVRRRPQRGARRELHPAGAGLRGVGRAGRVHQPGRGAAAPPRRGAGRPRVGDGDPRGGGDRRLPAAAAVQPLRNRC